MKIGYEKQLRTKDELKKNQEESAPQIIRSVNKKQSMSVKITKIENNKTTKRAIKNKSEI